MQADHLISDAFISACRDYFYLIDRRYPERGSLKLIGDRYRLNGDQRTVIYRGISSLEQSALRNSLLTHECRNVPLFVDGYNVLFSLLNYRLGRTVFISTDGILRDAGSLHGRIRNLEYFNDCALLLAGCLEVLKPVTVHIYFDSPVSHSDKHANLLKDMMGERGLKGECYLVRSADWALKHAGDGVLATSDTAIIEKAAMKVIDIPRMILETAFNARFLDLRGFAGLPGGIVSGRPFPSGPAPH